MEHRTLGPVVGLGTYATFEGDAAGARVVVDAALAAGTTTFDSSPMYGGAERSLGHALEGRRDGTTLATKIWTQSVEEGRAQYEAQRRFFGRVELEQVHNLVAWREHLAWIEAERDAGRIDRIGVTHWNAGSFGELERALRTGRFDTVQLPLNLGEREAEKRLLPLAEELELAVVVMSPFGGTGAPLLRPQPSRERARAASGLRNRDMAAGASEMGAVRPASRSRHPGHVASGAREENAAAGSPPWLGPDERAYVERLGRS